MKTITVEQLSELTWVIERVECDDHHFEVFEGAEGQYVDMDDDGDPIMEPRYSSYLSGTCLLRSVEHPGITYEICWDANGDSETFMGAYRFDITICEQAGNDLCTDDIEIVDSDGDWITPMEAEEQIGLEIMRKVDWELEVVDYLPTPPAPESIDDTDSDETAMETFELTRDDGPDVRFQGEEIASVTSYDPISGPRNIRWTEMELYRTKGGKWVCHTIGRTRFEGERTRHAVHVADTDAELVKAIGYGWLAKELYDDAGIEHAVSVD